MELGLNMVMKLCLDGKGPMKRAKKYFEPAFQSTKRIMLKNTIQRC